MGDQWKTEANPLLGNRKNDSSISNPSGSQAREDAFLWGIKICIFTFEAHLLLDQTLKSILKIRFPSTMVWGKLTGEAGFALSRPHLQSKNGLTLWGTPIVQDSQQARNPIQLSRVDGWQRPNYLSYHHWLPESTLAGSSRWEPEPGIKPKHPDAGRRRLNH